MPINRPSLIAGLLLIIFALLGVSPVAAQLEYVFPKDAGIIDVKRDFGAKGDGVTDDTAAVKAAVVAALNADYRNPKFVYFPNGTYILSDSIKARVSDKPDGEGGWSDGWRSGMALVGQTRNGVILKLKDNAPGFGEAGKPKTIIVTGSTGHGKGHDSREGGWGNEGFQNTLLNFTVDTGKGNPGAVGVDFLASNRGSMCDITIRSGDPNGAGHCGLDLSRPWPGPALVKNVSIEGFDVGLRQNGMDCSMTYEHITLKGQKVAGIEAVGHPVMSLRGVVSDNAVPVFRSVKGGQGIIMLIDGVFTYTGKDPQAVAIQNQENLLLQRVTVKGYKQVVVNGGGKNEKGYKPGLTLAEGQGVIESYTSRAVLRLSAGDEKLPNLPVKETPQWNGTDLSDWANVKDFGAATQGSAVDFTTLESFQRVDDKIDFGWGGGGPTEKEAQVGKDNFSVRWTGQIQAPADGEYTFYASINDRGRLWVDGKLILDKWEGYHSKEYEATKVQFKAGQRVDIRMDYWESGHDAWARLSWAGPGLEKQIVKGDYLYASAEAKKPGGLTGQYYGNANPDCTEAIQKAIDSGKSVIYFPNGRYPAKGKVIIRGKVRKLIGMEATLSGLTVQYDGTDNDTVFIEHLNGIHIIHNSDKALVVQRCNLEGSENTKTATGDMFIDDVMGGKTRINGAQSHWWVRQLNSEFGNTPQLINNGAKLWILGMKTEGNTTAIENNGGVVECYALYSMTTAPPEKATPFVFNNGGWMAVSFADGGQKSYFTKVKEIVDGKTATEETWRRETMLYLGGKAK